MLDRVFTDAPLGALLEHTVSRYHLALREDLPRLGRMADEVAEVHGERHAELHEHVHLENKVVLPRVVSLNAPAGARRAPGVGAH